VLAWALASLRRSSLDRALAFGADPCDSPALALRAARLTGNRLRERLAAEVDAVLVATTRRGGRVSAAVEPDRTEVALAAPVLIELERRLRSEAPIYAQGVARLRLILRDAGGPLYTPASCGALKRELEAVLAAVEGAIPESRTPP
jgi:hypothetical protein